MKKLLVVVVLVIFACGFGKVVLAVEAARSNSPLSKVDEPIMSDEAAPTVKEPVVKPEKGIMPAEKESDAMLDEAAVPADDAVSSSDEATEEDIMAPMEEGEEPISSDVPKKV